MAANKKGVIIYCDLIHTFEALEDDEAGRLIKHFLRYVNDLNPIAPDRIIQIAFEPIKQQLKRDLVKWEGEKAIRSLSGYKGGIKSGEARRSKTKQNEANEASASNVKQTEANEAVTVNVTVTDKVIVDVDYNIYIEKIKNDDLIFEYCHRVHKSSKEIFFEIVDSFFVRQKADGKEWKDFRDCRKHFNNWIKFYKKENGNTNDKIGRISRTELTDFINGK